jgi:hypothetical protein
MGFEATRLATSTPRASAPDRTAAEGSGVTIKELRERIADYPDDQFVHVRIWQDASPPSPIWLPERHRDVVVDKLQQGVDGAALITVTLKGEQP